MPTPLRSSIHRQSTPPSPRSTWGSRLAFAVRHSGVGKLPLPLGRSTRSALPGRRLRVYRHEGKLSPKPSSLSTSGLWAHVVVVSLHTQQRGGVCLRAVHTLAVVVGDPTQRACWLCLDGPWLGVRVDPTQRGPGLCLDRWWLGVQNSRRSPSRHWNEEWSAVGGGERNKRKPRYNESRTSVFMTY